MDRITVLIADDHSIVREGLRLVLEQAKDLEVVGEAATGREAVEKINQLQPRVAIVDLQMPEGDGFSVLKEIGETAPDTQVIMLTVHAEEEYVRQAMNLGAAGYVLKEIPKDELLTVVRKVAAGQAFVDSAVTKALLGQLKKAGQQQLSDREKEVLQLAANGMSNKEIATELHISIETVKTHIKHIFEKLEARDRAQAVAIGLREHLVD